MPHTPEDVILNDTELNDSITMPLMALRGLTVFPGMVITFEVERKKSIAALNAAAESGSRKIFLVTQKEILVDDPDFDALYSVGTVCTVRQLVKQPDGKINVMVEGKNRAELISADFTVRPPVGEARLITVKEIAEPSPKIEAMLRHVTGMFERYVDMLGNALPESVATFSIKREIGYMADYITQNMLLRYPEKQSVLETIDPISRLKIVSNLLNHELEVLGFQRDIGRKLHDEMSRNHRDNFLREQLRLIKSELGEEPTADEDDEYREKIRALGLEADVEKKLLKEVDKLARQPFGSQEGAVIRSYLDLCVELPWKTGTKERIDLEAARKVLDKDHFGLDKVKERIIEYLAVKKLAPDIAAPILCFVGPPGVGKTSIAMSIARATNRKLARMSLGGIHDEAEIRGHRKTYVGAMPGRIITAINQAHSNNPLLLLDEIDKLSRDMRGDPASALLEALDPEQNSTFRDHYLEIPFDLSGTMFITTANTTSTIPPALLDRMEVIELSSYTDEEKLQIAKKYLIPKQRKNHGLDAKQLKISQDAVRELISGYTRESGVRQLEREIGSVCRKAAAKVASEESTVVRVNAANVAKLIGPRKFKPENIASAGQVGIVNGLAWTSVGGQVLEVEAGVLEGSGKIVLTGNLGDVMKESAQAAISYIRSRTKQLGIDPNFYKTKDIHLHFPEGAVPKDGPSAGITITIALISALTGIPVRPCLAMTGEVTLSGRVLAIGGLNEKTMAALRHGLHTVIIPAENESDLEEIDQTVRRGLNFVLATNVDSVLTTALEINELPIHSLAREETGDRPTAPVTISQ